MITEVILELIGPTVDIIRLNFDLEGPVVFVDFFAELVELRELHDRHATGKVSYLCQVLSNGLSGAFVFHLDKNVGPSVLEEVEGLLTIKCEHSKPVG